MRPSRENAADALEQSNMTFTPERSGHLHYSMYSGNQHGPTNPGSVRGDFLADPSGQLAAMEDEADYYGINTIIFNVPTGAQLDGGLNTDFPAATAGILQRYYAPSWDWFVNTFPGIKRPGRRYGLYMGGRQNAGLDLDEYCPRVGAVIPPASFFVDAIAPFRALGFDMVWVDAVGGAPSLVETAQDVQAAHFAAGWRMGGEFWPHDGINHPGEGYDIDTAAASERPYMIVGAAFGVTRVDQEGGNFFATRFNGAPANSELHLCPQSGDTLITPEQIDLWMAQNLLLSPYAGFKASNPAAAARIAERNKARRRRGALLKQG